MKLIKTVSQIIKEAAGVPSGIYEAADSIFNSIVTKLSKLDQDDYLIDIYDKSFIVLGNFKIADIELKKIKYVFKFDGSSDTINVSSASVSTDKEFDVEYMTYKNIDLTTILKFFITSPENAKVSDLLSYFKKNDANNVATIAHELMHVFSYTKKPKEKLGKHAEYKLLEVSFTRIRSVMQFLWGYYYVSDAENTVRPTDLYSQLMKQGVKKKEFYDSFVNNDLFKELKAIKDFTYQKLYEDVSQNMDIVRNFLVAGGVSVEGLNETQIVNLFFMCFRATLISTRIENLKSFQSLSNPLFDSNLSLDEQISSLSEFEKKAEAVVQSYAKKISSNKRYTEEMGSTNTEQLNEEYFGNEIKKMNFLADKTIRKVSKVYSLLPEQKVINKEYFFKKKAKQTPKYNFHDIRDRILKILE